MTTTVESNDAPPSPFPFLSKITATGWQWVAWAVVLAGILVSRLYLVLTRRLYYFDESLYLVNTHEFVTSQTMTPWSWSPGVTLLNTPWYLLFRNVALGLDYTSRMAMIVCSLAVFVLMGLFLHRLLKGWTWVFVAFLISLVSAPFWYYLLNSSDSYYGVFLLLYLITVQYAIRQSPTHWSWLVTASILAFSMTIRNDGLIVFIVTGLLYAWQLWRAPFGWGRRIGAAVLWVAPLVVIMVLYWGAGQLKGGYYQGTQENVVMEPTSVSARTYVAFEQGVGYAERFELQREGKYWWAEGAALTAERYGSREENDNSVLQAILRNPAVTMARIPTNTRDFFISWQESFRERGVPLFIAALWGFALLWRRHPKMGIAFFATLAPTAAYFLITFWQPRYVAMLTPIFVIVAVYAVATFTAPPTTGERRWGIALTFLSLVAIGLFWWVGREYSLPLSLLNLMLALLVVGLLAWRFVAGGILPTSLVRFGPWGAVALVLLLLVGSLRVPIRAETENSPLHTESVAYVMTAFEQYRGSRVCMFRGDYDAQSLIWYARQRSVPIGVNIRTALNDNTLLPTMQERGCTLALIARTGWSDTALINTPDAIDESKAQILFRSVHGTIILLEPRSP